MILEKLSIREVLLRTQRGAEWRDRANVDKPRVTTTLLSCTARGKNSYNNYSLASVSYLVFNVCTGTF